MGKTTETGEKPKFDLITASKTKKYKIITAVVLIIGVLLLALGLLLRSTLTSAVTPNALTIVDGTLSNLEGTGPTNYNCTISIDQTFVLTTGTPQNRALANPIIFTLDNDAKQFLEIRDKTNTTTIGKAYYQGMFYLHLRDNVPEYVEKNGEQVRPSGYLTITCGSKILRIKFTYRKVN